MTAKVQALLFDLGGVVLDIDFNRAFEHWQPVSRLSLDEIRAGFRFDAAYQQHERGEIDAAQYFAHLCNSLQLQEGHVRIAEGWNAIFLGEISETLAMIRSARSHLPCYAFTNSNTAHQTAWSVMFPAVVQAFDRIFVSSDMGCRKPERQAFEHIAREIRVDPQAILFFDDLAENVAGAQAAGLQAVHVRGPADVRAALERTGCTP
ncbi:HAD-IA family hydrolase [Polaromonas sp.]|uniref:HAD-IA family hydrolase n=1 Tax=Polaromonas sp. TaxID=1869339 RepID=UPI003C9F2110